MVPFDADCVGKTHGATTDDRNVVIQFDPYSLAHIRTADLHEGATGSCYWIASTLALRAGAAHRPAALTQRQRPLRSARDPLRRPAGRWPRTFEERRRQGGRRAPGGPAGARLVPGPGKRPAPDGGK